MIWQRMDELFGKAGMIYFDSKLKLRMFSEEWIIKMEKTKTKDKHILFKSKRVRGNS